MKSITLLQTVLVLSFINGCSTTPATNTTSQNETGIVIEGITVKDAVITKYDDKYFYYKKKCKSCGFVSPDTIGSEFPKTPFNCKSTFTCPKCGVLSDVIIQRNR
jgi:predicted RNA-binding Zn-ribbon protein involved in translation (DUF1610 family)